MTGLCAKEAKLHANLSCRGVKQEGGLNLRPDCKTLEWQGLKPIYFVGFIGTTEVMP
jgi:hypothetical protein